MIWVFFRLAAKPGKIDQSGGYRSYEAVYLSGVSWVGGFQYGFKIQGLNGVDVQSDLVDTALKHLFDFVITECRSIIRYRVGMGKRQNKPQYRYYSCY